MRLDVLSWNSNQLNKGTSSYFDAYIPPDQMVNLTNNPVIINRANDYPFLSAAQRQGNTLRIGVRIKPGVNVAQYRETLKGYFFSDLKKHNLVAQDLADSSRQYYRSGIPIRMVQEGANVFNSFYIDIATEYPYWQLVTTSVDSWDITASGDSDTITNIGNLPVAPIITLTPTTTKTKGLKYERYVTLYNNMDRSFVAPLEITGGGLDVQSLINAGKLQASGNDLRVWQDGAFVDRWTNGVDSDSDPALVWVNESLSPRAEGITSAIFDSDDTTMSFGQTQANLAFLRTLLARANKSILVESEIVGYSDSDIDFLTYTIENISREQKGTTAVSHVSGSIVRHLEHDLNILYGDSDLGAPDTNDDNKPIFSLASLNSAWTWSNYFDSRSARPGAWKGEVLSTKTGLSYTFTDSDPETSANPSTKLGLAEIGTQSNQNPLNETATLSWLFSHPCGNTNVQYSGEIYRVSSWPAVVGLQYLEPNTAWFTAQNEVQPSTTSTWESIAPRNVSLGGTYETIRFAMDGSLSSNAGEQAMVQFSGVIVSFDSDNLPFVSVGSEQSINFFDFKLTNNATGEYIKVSCPCPINTALTVDCEQKIAYLADGTRVNVIFSSLREAWLDLQPGNNPLVYTDDGTVAVHVNITHRDRVL